MAKWNPENFNIAGGLFRNKEKPITFYTMESYFDRVANYSNGYFYSKDTVSSTEYKNPKISKTENSPWKDTKGGNISYVNAKDRDSSDIKLAFAKVKFIGGNLEITDKSLTIMVKKEVKKEILDGYWQRLSKEIVLNGAGALRLFLEEAERTKEEYANKPQTKPSLWAQLLGIIGIGVTSDNVEADLGGIDNGDNPQRLVTDTQNDGDTKLLPIVSPKVSPIQSVSPKTSPSPTPKISPSPSVSPTQTPTPKLSTTERININTANKELLMSLKSIKDAKSDAIILHRQAYGPFQKIEDIMNVSGIGQATFEEIKGLITVGDIVPTPSPVFYSSGGGGGGGGSSSSPDSTSSPQATPTPSVTPTPPPEPGDTNGDTTNPGDVLINEIAWMGTASSAFDEWIELYNTTDQAINLTGWTLNAQDGSPSINLASKSIGPFGFYLLEKGKNTATNILEDQVYTGDLMKNTGEYIELRDVTNEVIDFIDASTGWPAGDNFIKETAQKINGNWITAAPTPKAANQANTTAQNPSAVIDLVATLNSPLAVSWSAPDPGTYSPASLSYDLRYSLTTLTASGSWDTATKIASSSLPIVAEEGASQSASFDVAYQYGQTLYFALKTKLTTCGVGMCEGSDVSNIATISFPSAVDNDSWAMMGKNPHHTSFAANITGPDSTATISWQFDAEAGNAVGQIVVSADGDVYFGASGGSSNKLIKLDKNGVKQWEYATNVSIGTPAVLSDETIYFGRIGAGGVLAFTALNPDGSKKWDYNDASTINHVTVSSKGEPHFTYSSGADKLAVLNPDGSVKTLIGGISLSGFSPVVLDNGNIIVTSRVSGNQFFTKYSADGTQLWDLAYTGANGSMQSNPSYDQMTGKTYSAVGYDNGSTFAKIFVISSDGSSINTSVIAPANLGSGATMVAVTPTKLLVGLNYTWSNPASGSKLFALNKSDLTTSWSFQAEGKINQQIAVDQAGNAYFSTQTGHLYSIDAAGNQNWHISVGANSTISPILVQNAVIWGYDSRVVLVSE